MPRYNTLILLMFAACAGATRGRRAECCRAAGRRQRAGALPASTGRPCCATARPLPRGSIRPCLHYNIGVVRYELGDFVGVRGEFAQADCRADLAALCELNRGLALRAAGDSRRRPPRSRAGRRRAGDRDCAGSLRTRPTAGPRPARATAQRPASRCASRPGRGSAHRRASELTAAARPRPRRLTYRTPADQRTSDLAGRRATAGAARRAGRRASCRPELHAAYVLGNESGDTEEFLFRYDMDGAFYGTEFAQRDASRSAATPTWALTLGSANASRRQPHCNRDGVSSSTAIARRTTIPTTV